MVDDIIFVISVMSRMSKSSSWPGRMRCRSRSSAVIWPMACLIFVAEAALAMIWSTLVKRTGWGVSAVWVDEREG